MEDCDTVSLEDIFHHYNMKWQSQGGNRGVISLIVIILMLSTLLLCVSL